MEPVRDLGRKLSQQNEWASDILIEEARRRMEILTATVEKIILRVTALPPQPPQTQPHQTTEATVASTLFETDQPLSLPSELVVPDPLEAV